MCLNKTRYRSSLCFNIRTSIEFNNYLIGNTAPCVVNNDMDTSFCVYVHELYLTVVFCLVHFCAILFIIQTTKYFLPLLVILSTISISRPISASASTRHWYEQPQSVDFNDTHRAVNIHVCNKLYVFATYKHIICVSISAKYTHTTSAHG